MASFRQRNDTWRAEISVNGIRESATFDTKAQARAWASKRETQLREQSHGKLPDHSFLEAIERYLNEVSVKKKTHENEVKRMAFFKREYKKLCQKQLSKVTTDDLVQWRDSRLKEVQGATVRREANILASLFTVARKEWKWIKESPMADLTLPPPSKHRDRRIAQDEIDRLCLAANWDNNVPVNSTQQIIIAFLFAIETAMRAGEIVGLTWDRVYLKDRYLVLNETKNGTKRNVPLSKRAVELLTLLKGLDKKQVFTCNSQSFDTLWRKLRDRCQITDLHFHDTRHEACTRLARKLEVLDLARMIGHKDLRSLMIYYNATASEIATRLD
ncbi:UNVERIFIED_CONTAM: site-specific integrase [Acinetobacter baumannii]|nr:site-specific integrase [Acinetobacter baumannii]